MVRFHDTDTCALSQPLSGLRYQVRASADVDEHASYLSRWHQEYDQLSGGRFQGRVREVWLDAPRLQVFHEHTAQQTSQQCQPWPGAVWFGIPDHHQPDALHFCGLRQQRDDAQSVLVARAQDGFSLRTPHNFGIYGVVVEESWLQSLLSPDGERPQSINSARAFTVSAGRHIALCEAVEAILHLGSRHGMDDGTCGKALIPWVLRLLQLLCTPERTDPVQRQANPRRIATVAAARDLVAQPLRTAMTVDALCNQLHLTPRTLQNHFQSSVGVSPADFLKAVRLNACRRRLRSASTEGETVQDVAALWGFSHMGHFSHDYKAMFGELPSHTLRQARGPHCSHAL